MQFLHTSPNKQQKSGLSVAWTPSSLFRSALANVFWFWIFNLSLLLPRFVNSTRFASFIFFFGWRSSLSFAWWSGLLRLALCRGFLGLNVLIFLHLVLILFLLDVLHLLARLALVVKLFGRCFVAFSDLILLSFLLDLVCCFISSNLAFALARSLACLLASFSVSFFLICFCFSSCFLCFSLEGLLLLSSCGFLFLELCL